ncbi:uracil-DNA glycosylase [Phaeovulum sp. W22_SRMD_FR3]|uniref:uracil-DNA glycosylase n=1 Tax=Phaeovulum sp. W22_SRMD_FR3 TaxID=3240274 RepID=UPI003F99F851
MTGPMVPPAAWAHLPFFREDWPRLEARLHDAPGWLPGPARVFAALDALAPDDVRVVILGQDPYPTPGHAIGRAFAVAKGTALPRSLVNIFREVTGDCGACPPDGTLRGWERQGVLLLNTALSVMPGAAGAHARWGWERLSAQVLAELAATRPRAFLLWGAHAQKAAAAAAKPPHLVIATPHPSPLSARRGFFGSRPFSAINSWLAARGEPEINWSAA